MNGDIGIHGDAVVIDGRQITLPHPVDDAFLLGDLLVILYAPSSVRGDIGQFNNLVALKPSGEPIWSAELPTTETGDCYYQVVSRVPIIASSVKSLVCTLDSLTGRIVRKVFVK